MKKLSLLIGLLLSLCISSFAQEQILKKDGTVIQATILEKTVDYIIYLDINNEKQVISLRDVRRVQKVQEVEPAEEIDYVENESSLPLVSAPAEEDPYQTKYGKNLIGVNFFELGLLLNIHAYYERIFLEGFMAVNASVGIAGEKSYPNVLEEAVYLYNERYNVDIYLYPGGQRRLTYFVGPSLGYGNFLEENIKPGAPDIERQFSSFYLVNGFVASVTPNFCMSLKGGFGVMRSYNSNTTTGDAFVTGYPMINFFVSGRF